MSKKQNKNEINIRVAACRKLRNLTQERTAELLDIRQNTYSTMERQGNISAQMLLRLADVFDVDPVFLLIGENRPNFLPSDFEAEKDENLSLVHQENAFYDREEFYKKSAPSNSLESAFKVLRNMKKESQQRVIDFISQVYKEDKNK